MASVINTNMPSLNAQRNLTTSQNSLATSLQRLSSGLRINSAKDDAAGLAISERFTTQIRGTNQAVRNANDGISLAQTAEGAMAEIGNNLQRIRELSVQSANATNSKSDRAALNAEVKQLTEEINRVAKQTNFNGTNLLDGSFAGALFQVGADSGQTIGINSIVNAKTDALGASKFANVYTGTTLDDGDDTNGKEDLATEDTTYSRMRIAVTDKDGNVNNVDIGDFKVAEGQSITQATAAALNSKMAETGVYAEVEDGVISLSSIKGGQTFAISFDAPVSTDADATVADAAMLGLTETSTNGGALTGVTNSYASDLDITTVAGSQQALEIIDAALTSVNSSRADMGAIQNRFASVVTNLQTSAENLTASRSRILDTDFASETANLTRGQILQQAGTAMLAQANSLPNGVLALLQG